MAIARIYSRASIGIDAPLVTIEVHLANGLPAFNLVGLAQTAVRESRDRVRSALINSGFEFPAKRITVSLAPADLPKEGGRFDLAIAIAVIAASGLLPELRTDSIEVVGELALNGEVRTVTGALPFNFACQQANRLAILPEENCPEAAIIQPSKILLAKSLHQVFLHLAGHATTSLYQPPKQECQWQYDLDMADIVGQESAKRALEIAAAGSHNLLLVGPPGTGKTMLAQRLPTLLPPMTDLQALESARIYSILGHTLDASNWKARRFRAPHHTSSAVALVGGGAQPKPGEISLAHHGVLFLDELPEFERRVLDVLREPLESGQINISRAAGQVCFPADFQLVAAMNPSPTGDLHDNRCSPDQIMRYLSKVSGPFLDRIDLQIDVPKLPSKQLMSTAPHQGDSSAVVRQRVSQAQATQLSRAGKLNQALSAKELKQICPLQHADVHFLQNAMERLHLSMRACHRILRVARTLADLQQQTNINSAHLSEALSYRAVENIIRQLSR